VLLEHDSKLTRSQEKRLLDMISSSSVMQLSHNNLEKNRLFESYKENLMEFLDQLLNYLYSFTICLYLKLSSWLLV